MTDMKSIKKSLTGKWVNNI